MKKKSKYRKIRSFVSNDDLASALKGLLKIAELINYTKSRDNIYSLQSRNSHLIKKEQKGIANLENARVERNLIREAILKETNDLEDYEREERLEVEGNKIELAEEKIFRITKTAIIVIEIEKISENFHDENSWYKREEILRGLFKFSDHTTIRLAREVFKFLSDIASLTRSGMNPGTASAIESLVINFFPYRTNKDESEREEVNNIALQCVHLADNIFYDAAIHLENLKVGLYGLQILKWIYWIGKERKSSEIIEKVIETYQELEQTLNRPENDNLEMTKRLLAVFKKDLNNRGLTIPFMPDELYRLI